MVLVDVHINDGWLMMVLIITSTAVVDICRLNFMLHNFLNHMLSVMVLIMVMVVMVIVMVMVMVRVFFTSDLSK